MNQNLKAIRELSERHESIYFRAGRYSGTYNNGTTWPMEIYF